MQIFTYLALVLTISCYWAQCMAVLKVVVTGHGKSGEFYVWAGHVFLCATIALGVHVGW